MTPDGLTSNTGLMFLAPVDVSDICRHLRYLIPTDIGICWRFWCILLSLVICRYLSHTYADISMRGNRNLPCWGVSWPAPADVSGILLTFLAYDVFSDTCLILGNLLTSRAPYRRLGHLSTSRTPVDVSNTYRCLEHLLIPVAEALARGCGFCGLSLV